MRIPKRSLCDDFVITQGPFSLLCSMHMVLQGVSTIFDALQVGIGCGNAPGTSPICLYIVPKKKPIFQAEFVVHLI